jgi:hypothetical protein
MHLSRDEVPGSGPGSLHPASRDVPHGFLHPSPTPGAAAAFDPATAQEHGFPLSATVACGDSGNDILMLSGPNLAIVVGNAQVCARTFAQERACVCVCVGGGEKVWV